MNPSRSRLALALPAILALTFLGACSENKQANILVPPPSQPSPPAYVKEAPRNDGSVARKSAPMDMLLRWDEWDANGDGYADPSEQEAMREKLAVEASQPPEEKKEPEKVEVAIVPQEQGAPRETNRGGGGADGGGANQLFASSDANGDGMLSLDEAPDRMKERFSDLDTNGDGQVDQAEMEAIRERFRQARGGGGGGRGGFGGAGGGRDRGGGGAGRDRGGNREPMQLTRPN